MFKVVISLEDKGTFETFPEAFAHFKQDVEELIKNGTSAMVLYEGCNINDGKICLGTRDAIAAAHYWGLLAEDGSLVEPAPIVEDKQWQEVGQAALRAYILRN